MKKTLLCVLLCTPSLAHLPLLAEPIPLFGQVVELEISQRIPECPKTWDQLRNQTLAYLNAQPQTATSPAEAQKLLQALNKELAKKNNDNLVFLTAQTQASVWETASVFQLGQGSDIDPQLQQNIDINSGLYQIETALEEALHPSCPVKTPSNKPAQPSPKGSSKPSPKKEKPSQPTSFEWSTQ